MHFRKHLSNICENRYSLRIAENLSLSKNMLEFSEKSLSLARSLSLFCLEFSEKCWKNKPVLWLMTWSCLTGSANVVFSGWFSPRRGRLRVPDHPLCQSYHKLRHDQLQPTLWPTHSRPEGESLLLCNSTVCPIHHGQVLMELSSKWTDPVAAGHSKATQSCKFISQANIDF